MTKTGNWMSLDRALKDFQGKSGMTAGVTSVMGESFDIVNASTSKCR